MPEMVSQSARPVNQPPSHSYYFSKERYSFANMFAADQDDDICAIGVFWHERAAEVGDRYLVVSAYVDCDSDNPVSGNCVVSMVKLDAPSDAEVDFIGYRVLDLPTSFHVKKGSRFSIIIETASVPIGVLSLKNAVRGQSFVCPHPVVDFSGEYKSIWYDFLDAEYAGLTSYYGPSEYNTTETTPFVTAYTRNDVKKITLHASDGEVEDGIAIDWTFTKNGTYDLYRGNKGGALSCIARGLTTHVHIDKIDKEHGGVEPDKWYDYKVVDTTNGIESNIDSGMVGTKPVLEEVRVAKLWLEQDPPYNVQLKWNRYNTKIFHVEEGDFVLDGIKNTTRHYKSQVAEIGKSGGEKVIDLAVGNPALDIDYGGHGDYNMSVDWKYTNLESGHKKVGNSVKDVVAKVYFHKYDRPVDNISNWYIFWPKDEAIDTTAARLMKQMKPEIWIKNAPSQFDGSFYFNPASISSLGGTLKKLKGIRKADSRWISASEGEMSKLAENWVRAKRKLGLEGDDKVYVWEVEPQLQYFLTDGAAAHGDTISSSGGGYAGESVGSNTEGLPCVADVMVHEMMHGWLFKNLYLGNLCIGRLGRDGWLQRNAHEPEINWHDWVLCNAPDGPDSFLLDIQDSWAVDSDGDGVSDIYEMNFPELSINNRDTLNVKSYDSSYADYGDNEYLARREETRHEWNRVAVHAENDWAFPGSKIAKDCESYTLGSWKNARKSVKESLQNDFSPDTSTKAYARLANAIAPNDDEDSHSSGSLKAFYRPTIGEFIFDVLEIVSVGEGGAQKIEDGGPYTSLSFPVSVTNMTALDESCVLRGYLLDGQSNAVAWASSVLDIPAGSVASGSLVFNSEHLYSSENKDLSLAWVAVEPLGDEFGAVFDITNAMARTEQAYSLNEFAPPPARIDAQHIAEEMGEKGLAIIVPVENFTADDLRVVATLAGTNGQYVATASTNIAQGASLARLEFPKAQFAYSRIHGPYVVSSVQMLRGSESVCGKMNVYVTREYDESEILPENPVIMIKEDSFAHVAVQRSGEIAFAFSVSNCTAEAVSYRVKAFMFATNGTFVCSSITNVVLESGGNNVRISFDVNDIPDSAAEPYWVREVILDPVGDVGMRDHFYPVPYYFDTVPITPSVVFCEGVSSGFEGGVATIRISGGNVDKVSSVDVHLSYNTATSSDVDLAKGTVDGVLPKGGLKFPLTLNWAEGEVGEKVIEIPVKADKAVEGDEFFTLQLANAIGVEVGDVDVCTLTIKDANTYATLQDGVMNPNIKVSTSGDGKWTVERGWRTEASGELGLYHVQSPALAPGQSSMLSMAALKGAGEFQFYLRFIGDPNEETPSSLSVYDGSKLLGVIDHAMVTNVWKDYYITMENGTSATISNYKFVFTQGSDPDTHVEFTDIFWYKDATPVCNVRATSNDSDGGYVSGSGLYSKGQTAKLTAKPLPGWVFDGWFMLDPDMNPEEADFILWSKAATVSHKVTTNLFVTAFFSKIPYIRVLADPADGGKVSGSGLCEKGKKVTLKATANKNFTFLGWRQGTGNGEWGTGNGFVATTASLVIDRSAKPTASSKTSTTITNVTGDVTYYAVFKSDPKVTVAVEATDGKGDVLTGKGAGKYVAGTITGEGKYAPGKKVTLKAAANKDYVYAGWEKTGNGEWGTGNGFVSQAASISFVMPSNDVEYVAKFITTDDDKRSIKLVVNGVTLSSASDDSPTSTNIWTGVYLEWPVAATALSEAKVKVAGLPTGLKFVDKPVTSKIGTGKAAITVTNVPANTIYGAPTAASKTTTDRRTGATTVTPSAVKVTVTTAGKSSQTYQIDTTVLPLPAWAQGTYSGNVKCKMENGEFGVDVDETMIGTVALTVDAKGKVSGKALGDGLTYTLAAPYYSGFALDENMSSNFLADVTASWSYKEGKKTVKTNDVVLLTVADNGIGGVAAGAAAWDTAAGDGRPPEWTAWQYNWKVDPWKTLGKKFDKQTQVYAIREDGTFIDDDEAATVALDTNVTGRVTLKFAASGTLSVSGEFVTGYDEKKQKYTTVKATGAATLVPIAEDHGEVFIYLTPKGLPPHARSFSVQW